MTTSSQKHAALKRLGKQAAKGVYDMLKLATEILADSEYVDQFGGEGPLIDMMEAEEFAHFGGVPSLTSMLRAYRENPMRTTWEEHRFNVQAMIELATPVRNGADKERINWKALAKELQAKLDQAEAVVADLRKSNADLRSKLDAAVTEAAETRGRLSAMEGLMKRRAA